MDVIPPFPLSNRASKATTTLLGSLPKSPQREFPDKCASCLNRLSKFYVFTKHYELCPVHLHALIDWISRQHRALWMQAYVLSSKFHLSITVRLFDNAWPDRGICWMNMLSKLCDIYSILSCQILGSGAVLPPNVKSRCWSFQAKLARQIGAKLKNKRRKCIEIPEEW